MGPEKVLERKGEMDLRNRDISCNGLCLRGEERNGTVVEEGGGIKRRGFCMCV